MRNSIPKLLHKAALVAIPLGAIALLVYANSNLIAKPTVSDGKIAILENTTEVARGAATTDINAKLPARISAGDITTIKYNSTDLGNFEVMLTDAGSLMELALTLHAPGDALADTIMLTGATFKSGDLSTVLADITLNKSADGVYGATIPVDIKLPAGNSRISLAGNIIGFNNVTPMILAIDSGRTLLTDTATGSAHALGTNPINLAANQIALDTATVRLHTKTIPTGGYQMTLTGTEVSTINRFLGSGLADAMLTGNSGTIALNKTGGDCLDLANPLTLNVNPTTLTLTGATNPTIIGLHGRTTNGLPLLIHATTAAASSAHSGS
jgi:hypothetical protein